MATGGPQFRDPAPQALRRDRTDGRRAPARARGVPERGDGDAQSRKLESFSIKGRGARTPEAPLEHLREDGRRRQGVRRHLRPRRPAGHRRARSATAGPCSGRSTRSGRRSRAGSRTTSTRPSSTSTSRCTRRSSGRAASPSRSRCAPRRCTGVPSSASRRTGATRRGRRTRRSPGCSASPTSKRRRTDPIAFLEALKLDLGQDEVYVFTPKGRVIALIEGATTIDFAYAVHTEVGHHCVGAKVNGRLVPLDTVAALGGRRRDRHRARTTRRVRRATGSTSPSRRGPSPRSASGSSASDARTPSRGAARSSSRPCAARGCRSRRRCRSSALDAVIASLNLDDLDALVHGHRQRPDLRARGRPAPRP